MMLIIVASFVMMIMNHSMMITMAMVMPSGKFDDGNDDTGCFF